jgi:hypothetical protein
MEGKAATGSGERAGKRASFKSAVAAQRAGSRLFDHDHDHDHEQEQEQEQEQDSSVTSSSFLRHSHHPRNLWLKILKNC